MMGRAVYACSQNKGAFEERRVMDLYRRKACNTGVYVIMPSYQDILEQFLSHRIYNIGYNI